MSKTLLYSTICFLFIGLGAFWYFFIFGGTSHVAIEEDKIFGKVAEKDIRTKSFALKVGDRKSFNVRLTEDAEIINLYNQKDNFRVLDNDFLVSVVIDDIQGNNIKSSKVDVRDTSFQHEITSYDDGGTFMFNRTDRFQVVLNSEDYSFPEINCESQNTITLVSSDPGANPPFYSREYKASKPGLCTLRSGDFEVSIEIIE